MQERRVCQLLQVTAVIIGEFLVSVRAEQAGISIRYRLCSSKLDIHKLN